MKDALATLGTIITGDEKRDAVHIACLPAKAAHLLSAGDRVGYKDGVASEEYEHIGIVDPFLVGYVSEGKHFWIFVFPRTITGLSHVWTHPKIADEKSDAYWAEDVLRGIGRDMGIDFDDLIEGGRSYKETGVAKTVGYEADVRTFNSPELFWKAWSEYTGEKSPEEKDVYWSCSC